MKTQRVLCRVFYETALKIYYPGCFPCKGCNPCWLSWSQQVFKVQAVSLILFCLWTKFSCSGSVCHQLLTSFFLMSFIQACVETGTLSEPVAGTERISGKAAMELLVFRFPQNGRFSLWTVILLFFESLRVSQPASTGFLLVLALTGHCPPAPESQAILWHLWMSQTYYPTASWF